MNKLLLALILSVASTSYAATDATDSDHSSVNKSENPVVQKQQNIINKNNKKSSAEKARITKSKDKGMHIKDEITDTNQNEPADPVEIKSPSPTVNQK